MQQIFRVYRAEKENARQMAELAVLMWTEHTVDGLSEEFAGILEDGGAVFLAEVAGAVVGFAQCQLRHDYVEGTKTSPVGYLEGNFVRGDYRRLGLAKQLLAVCEKWAVEQGCTEFASDCELSNTASQEFHKRLGFQEANRVVCFVKPLER
jgi:aminoglycoside 6'-N-acetyltransferase I